MARSIRAAVRFKNSTSTVGVRTTAAAATATAITNANSIAIAIVIITTFSGSHDNAFLMLIGLHVILPNPSLYLK